MPAKIARTESGGFRTLRVHAHSGMTERRQARRSPGSARGMGHAVTLRSRAKRQVGAPLRGPRADHAGWASSVSVRILCADGSGRRVCLWMRSAADPRLGPGCGG
jgi:hypothetical protein